MRYANALHTMIDAGDGRFIPCDPANADYAALLASGVEILPYVAPAAPPINVSPWQARMALANAGKLAAVEAAVEALGSTHPAYIAWHYAESVRRDSPLIAALAPTIGLTDADLDALFETAKGLRL